MEVQIKEIAKNRVYLFCAYTPVPVTEEMLKTFIDYVMDYVQSRFPNHCYNYYEESHHDMLSVVALLDGNDLEVTKTTEF